MIVEKLYDDKYIALYEENSIRIYGKIALYKSVFNGEYEIITNVVITQNEKPIYKADNIHIPYNKEGLINISTYVEKIIAYIEEAQNNKVDPYWIKVFLNDFFIKSKTVKLEIVYRRIIRNRKEEKENKETEEMRNKIEELKNEIQCSYNKKGYAVIYGLFELIVLNDKKLIDRQNDKQFKEFVENNYNNPIVKDIIIKDIRLNWGRSDISVLEDLLGTILLY